MNNDFGQFDELMKQILEILSKYANQALKAFDLTFSQRIVMELLFHAGKHTLSQKELAGRLYISQPTVAGIIKRLHKKGFVRIVTDPSDGRLRMIQLTEEGLDCYQRTEEMRPQMEALFGKAFSEEEKGQFLFLLTKLRDTLVRVDPPTVQLGEEHSGTDG